MNNTRGWYVTHRDSIFQDKLPFCINCLETNKEVLQLHHVVPLSVGGTNNKWNIVVLCEKCHSIIHKKIVSTSLIKEGIKKAQENGTKSGIPIGRPGVKIPDNFKKYYDKWIAKEITAVEFRKLLDIGKTTLYRYINIFEKNKQEVAS